MEVAEEKARQKDGKELRQENRMQPSSHQELHCYFLHLEAVLI